MGNQERVEKDSRFRDVRKWTIGDFEAFEFRDWQRSTNGLCGGFDAEDHFHAECQPNVDALRYRSVEPAIRKMVENDGGAHGGIIDGKRYLAAILPTGYLYVSSVAPDGSYRPVARVDLGDFEYPVVEVKNNAIVIDVGVAHHGVWTTRYTFVSQNGAFRLSGIKDFADVGGPYNDDPAHETITLATADLAKSTARYWEKRLRLYQGNDKEYKPGMRAWSRAMDDWNKYQTLPFPACRSARLPRRTFLLDGFSLNDASLWLDRVFLHEQGCTSS